ARRRSPADDEVSTHCHAHAWQPGNDRSSHRSLQARTARSRLYRGSERSLREPVGDGQAGTAAAVRARTRGSRSRRGVAIGGSVCEPSSGTGQSRLRDLRHDVRSSEVRRNRLRRTAPTRAVEDEMAKRTKTGAEGPSSNHRMNPPGETPAGYPER